VTIKSTIEDKIMNTIDGANNEMTLEVIQDPVGNSEFYDKLKAALYDITVEASVSYKDAKDAFSRLLEEEYNV